MKLGMASLTVLNTFKKIYLKYLMQTIRNTFSRRQKKLLTVTASLPVFLRCAEYLLQADSGKNTKAFITAQLHQKFDTLHHVGLEILQSRLAHYVHKQKMPSLKDLFSKNFLPNETVLFSLQRSNRNFPGMVIIRKPDGTFARNKDGSLFHAPQIARAITNYPFYITNGNTPQGIFRWTGFEISKLLFYWPHAQHTDEHARRNHARNIFWQ